MALENYKELKKKKVQLVWDPKRRGPAQDIFHAPTAQQKKAAHTYFPTPDLAMEGSGGGLIPLPY